MSLLEDIAVKKLEEGVTRIALIFYMYSSLLIFYVTYEHQLCPLF